MTMYAEIARRGLHTTCMLARAPRGGAPER
jgi:hypothetical protein